MARSSSLGISLDGSAAEHPRRRQQGSDRPAQFGPAVDSHALGCAVHPKGRVLGLRLPPALATASLESARARVPRAGREGGFAMLVSWIKLTDSVTPGPALCQGPAGRPHPHAAGSQGRELPLLVLLTRMLTLDAAEHPRLAAIFAYASYRLNRQPMYTAVHAPPNTMNDLAALIATRLSCVSIQLSETS